MYQQPKRLALKLKAIREYLGLSQTEMKDFLKIKSSYNHISEFERGIRVPTILTLLAYARAGNVSLESLVDDELELTF